MLGLFLLVLGEAQTTTTAQTTASPTSNGTTTTTVRAGAGLWKALEEKFSLQAQRSFQGIVVLITVFFARFNRLLVFGIFSDAFRVS